MGIKNILKLLSLAMLFFGCGVAYTDSSKIVYYDWATIERYNGKPVFSVKKSLSDIKKSKDYYQVYYKNNTVLKIFTYKNNIIIRKDYMNSNGMWSKYIISDNTICNVNYIYMENNLINHIIKCTNGATYKNKYINTELVESKTYKNNKLINRRVITNGQCRDYNQNNQLLETYECYSYEETRPIEPTDFSKELQNVE